MRHHVLCTDISFLFISSILSTRTIPLFIKNGRVCGIIEPCNWCEKVPKIMQRTLSLLYVHFAEAVVSVPVSFHLPLPSGNTFFPPSCLSYHQISVAGNETTSPWAITRAALARTHIFVHTHISTCSSSNHQHSQQDHL